MAEEGIYRYIDEHVNLDDVFHEDRGYVREILATTLALDTKRPSFRVNVKRMPSHYHILIKGWMSNLGLKKLAHLLCSTTRGGVFDCLHYDSAVIPDVNSGPALVLRVNQSGAVAKRERTSLSTEDHISRVRAMAKARDQKINFGSEDNIDLENVDAVDRDYVRELLLDMLLWDPELPTVKVNVVERGKSYACLFSGWDREIDISAFVERFIDDRRRGNAYEAVMQDAQVIPIIDPKEGGPYLMIPIQRGFRSTRPSHRRR